MTTEPERQAALFVDREGAPEPPPQRPLRCAGALIIDDDGRIFVQRRSASRRLFPDCWDVVGGHVDPGETVQDALYREVYEETGWHVSHVLGEVGDYAYRGEDGVARLETDFLVRVEGDLSRPKLEAGKHTEYRWITASQTALLDEHRGDEGLIRMIVDDGFAAMHQFGLAG